MILFFHCSYLRYIIRRYENLLFISRQHPAMGLLARSTGRAGKDKVKLSSLLKCLCL